jgi:hypothetical protein
MIAAPRKKLIVVPRPLPAAPRRYLIVVLVDACGAARRASQVIDRGAQAVVHGAARCALQVFDRVAQAVACGAATLSQQAKNNSAVVQRNRENVTGFICIAI